MATSGHGAQDHRVVFGQDCAEVRPVSNSCMFWSKVKMKYLTAISASWENHRRTRRYRYRYRHDRNLRHQ